MDLRLMLISAVITVVISAPFMMRSANRGAYQKKSEKIIADAKKAGRVAQAALVSKSIQWGEHGSPDALQRQNRMVGSYVYTIDGQRYTHTASSADDLPETLTVYYPSGHPEKAISRYTYLVGAKPVGLVMLPVIVWVVVYQILNGVL